MSSVAAINYDIPDELHRRAKAAAAMRGVTLKDFLIEALEAAVEHGATSGKSSGEGRGR